MADITIKEPTDEEVRQAIELLFFAYRDFVADPDKVLAEYESPAGSLGRAHHRVIHFVSRNPGMTVAELLSILQITKQSLARVLRQLIDEGFVAQERGPEDARQRLLYLTDKGEAFETALSNPQRARFRRLFEKAGPEASQSFRRLLLELINEDEREQVLALIAGRQPTTP
ncbi:MarR family transcriptional regulator [Emcibacter sp. SYSU 3D8]|uniref:MarR family winged helix-turn-helix transcriptional regulator n=1 Tax=Emcibacter sp. SYSU 3D8 TaxID=3133969 RepID=UPI0031FE6DA6